MTEDMANVRLEQKEVDLEKLAALFPAAAGLMLAVHTTVSTAENPQAADPIAVLVTAALDPPDEYKADLDSFGDLFGLIAGIFKKAAAGELDKDYPNPVPADSEPQWPEFLE